MIECVDVRKAYGGTSALDGVDVVFPFSGLVALVGPNGAGKTTLLNVLTGFEHPDSGRCSVGNQDVTRRNPVFISRLGVARTFQEVRLIRDVSAIENVAFARPRQAGEHLLRGLFGLGVADEESRNLQEAERLLQFVGLTESRARWSQELSYGQQKLLTLACVLATEARILLLDEPVSGVDPAMRERILELLTRLRANHRLVLFIEHDLDAVRRAADIVFAMDNGKILAHGKPNDVLGSDSVLQAFVTG
jgi:ABC-type branched-subunit amino acid transport system ATPase component